MIGSSPIGARLGGRSDGVEPRGQSAEAQRLLRDRRVADATGRQNSRTSGASSALTVI
jgi:hypothetical protein